MKEKFAEKQFSIPALKGISVKNIEEHLKLYSGYVKNANTILDKIEEYKKDSESNAYALGELQRRFAFEYDGMRNHELYFDLLSGGAKELSEGSLKQAVEKTWGSVENFIALFKAVALTRGVGWAFLYFDKADGRLLTQWIDEQHLGHLTGATPVLGIDMWEHAFVFDYQPSGKKQYVDDFFLNLNWGAAEKRFEDASK